ncbi:MAG: hypothetical protein WAV52_03220 [Luteococcus japonicus]
MADNRSNNPQGGAGRRDDRAPRRDDRGERPERGYGNRPSSESRGYRRDDERPAQGRGYPRDDERPSSESRGYRRDDERPAQGRGYRREDSRGTSDRRDDRGGYQGGDDRGARGRDDRRRDERPRRDEEDFVRPGLAAREDEPETPEGVDEKLLPFSVRAELRGLPKDLGHIVAAHMVAAGELIDEDPALAYRHAEAARRRAARLPVVREATAETAYAAGEFAVALNEYRALRRMTGGAEYLPVMADCERALGRPENALKLAKEAAGQALDAVQRTEMLLVEAGARDDMGNRAEALRLLKNAIGDKTIPKESQARLRYAYADLLESSEQKDAARQWFVSAAKYDTEELLDTQDRINALDGFVIESVEDDDEDEDEELPSEGDDA